MKVSYKEIEIRYGETDMMGIVYHSNYLQFFELGRTHLIKELGFDYRDMEKAGFLSPVTNVNIHYKKSTTYGDVITVKTWIEEYTGVRTTYGYEITNEKGDICVTGTSSHTVVKKENFRPVTMKKAFPVWHEVYEQNKK